MHKQILSVNLPPHVCPCCGKEHPIEYKQVMAKSLYNEVTIEHKETYRYCQEEDMYYLSDMEIQENHEAKLRAYKETQYGSKNVSSISPIGARRYSFSDPMSKGRGLQNHHID